MIDSNYYDKTDEYKNNIEPLIKQLKMECNVEKIPMFVTVAIKNTEKETVYMSDAIYASCDLQLTDKKIGQLLLLSNGFSSEPPERIKECIRELQDYIDQNSTGIHLEGVSLTSDRISVMDQLVRKNGHIIFNPQEKMITEDFYE